MTTNNRIKVSELDYNQIRENLKVFMRGQSQFTDYDFDGSALSTLIDVLAYNTHYNALYTNLAINEMFLDSASKRSSVVSIANNYGYTPLSSSSARVNLYVTITEIGATAPIKYIPRGSTFATSIDNTPYTFYTITDYTAERNGNVYTFDNVEAYEGTAMTQLFMCTENYQKFVIPNKNVDINTLSITVQQGSEKPDYEKYIRATDVLELTPTSKIFYIKELEDSTYEVSFGSSGLGLPIVTGNIITMNYMVTNKAAGNGAYTFTYTGPGLGGIVSATAADPSYGGKDPETVEEIKRNVSQHFFDQNRAVTPGDYSALIKRYYTNVDSISVWGGENNDPPQYGRVYICIKPTNSPYLTPTEKTYISNTILKSKNVVSVTPMLIDPLYMELELITNVYYNKNKTTRSVDEIKTAVTQTIMDYNTNYLNKFDGIFRMSKFSSAVDASDQSILSSITTFKMYCEITPKYNTAAEYRLNIMNPIYNSGAPEESFASNGFYLDNTGTVYYLDDDAAGNIRVYTIIQGTGQKVIKYSKIGTIDYTTGSIKINGLKISDLVESNFYFIIKTQSFDVVSVRDHIVTIPYDRMTVNVIADTTYDTNNFAGTSYKFSSSRN